MDQNILITLIKTNMKIKNALLSAIALISTVSFSTIVQADTINSRCDIYPKGEDKASGVVNCTFSQRQGFITIEREDGITHELKPNGTNEYLDQNGVSVISEDDGPATIFRFNDESVYVY